MPRKWKNSDESTYYTDKAIDNRLEKLRVELIQGYNHKKFSQKNSGKRINYTHKNK